ELLYPFPQQQILDEVARYPNLREVVWAQEEPRNMGARAHMSPRLLHILPSPLEFGYVGRPERARPRAAGVSEPGEAPRRALIGRTLIQRIRFALRVTALRAPARPRARS